MDKERVDQLDEKQIKKILREQIELLAEISKVTSGPEFVAKLSLAMAELAKVAF